MQLLYVCLWKQRELFDQKNNEHNCIFAYFATKQIDFSKFLNSLEKAQSNTLSLSLSHSLSHQGMIFRFDFKSKGRVWRTHSSVCESRCEVEALTAAWHTTFFLFLIIPFRYLFVWRHSSSLALCITFKLSQKKLIRVTNISSAKMSSSLNQPNSIAICSGDTGIAYKIDMGAPEMRYEKSITVGERRARNVPECMHAWTLLSRCMMWWTTRSLNVEWSLFFLCYAIERCLMSFIRFLMFSRNFFFLWCTQRCQTEGTIGIDIECTTGRHHPIGR
jgi:hypothetical protein